MVECLTSSGFVGGGASGAVEAMMMLMLLCSGVEGRAGLRNKDVLLRKKKLRGA